MEEFLKLDWSTNDLSKLEHQTCFLSNEAIQNSHIYKSFNKPLQVKQEKAIKLGISNEKYVPGKKYVFWIRKRSLLRKGQKDHCLKAMKLLQSEKNPETFTASEKYSVGVYTECQPKIVEENRQFLEYAKSSWDKQKTRQLKVKLSLMNYGKYKWRHKILNMMTDYPQFYQEMSLISLNYDVNESCVEYNQVANLFEKGTVARFSQPGLKEPCFLKVMTLPKENDEVTSKLPVSRDENIKKLLHDHDIQIVTSSSALKQIIDYTETKTKWMIPIIVKEISFDDDAGKKVTKKVVFVDKVLPKTKPSYFDMRNFAYKQLLKTNFCQHEAFSFPEEETKMNCKEEQIEEPESAIPVNKRQRTRVILHNVSYRLWQIKKIAPQNILMKNQIKNTILNVLVRTKIDGCEITEQGVLQPVIVSPKVEHQIQFGANIPTRSELAREWASLFFRKYSNVYRARLYSPLSELIAIDKCSIQRVNNEALLHYQYKPILGLGVLQKVLEELSQLEPGKYLLRHLPKHGAFVSLMKESEERGQTGADLRAEYENVEIDERPEQNWVPIDVNYILPVHEDAKTIPAMFLGFDKTNDAGRIETKGGNKKKKKKAKPGPNRPQQDETNILP